MDEAPYIISESLTDEVLRMGTVISVEGPHILAAYREHDSIFTMTVPIAESQQQPWCARIHEEERPRGVYYRGVRVWSFAEEQSSIFRWNLQHGVTLTEDRTMGNSYAMGYILGQTIAGLRDVGIIRRCLLAQSRELESTATFESVSVPSEEFLSVTRELRNHGDANQSAVSFMIRHDHVPPDLGDVSSGHTGAADSG